MKKTLLILLLLQSLSTIKAQQIIYIPTDYSSLREAYDAINTVDVNGQDVISQDVEIRLINTGTSIPLTPISDSSFTWLKTGTDDYSIKIISEDFDNPAIITRESSSLYMLEFIDIKNIHFYNIVFENASLAFKLDNVKNSTIKYCKFIGDLILDDLIYQSQGGCGGATIWIGSEDIMAYSEYNSLKYNVFTGPRIGTYIRKHLYHSIYISYRNNHNLISGNTILDPSGSGIVFNHGYQNDNLIFNNCINKIYEQVQETQYLDGDSINNCNGTPTTYNIQNNGRDQFINSMQCIKMNEGDINSIPIENEISNNYTFSDINNNNRYNIYNGNSNIIVKNDLTLNNVFNNNHFDYDKKVYDSYWLENGLDSIQDRVVSGDFNKDGKIDDLVVFKKTGNSETAIKTLLKRNDNSFELSNKIFSGYNADLITGRLVSGDFDNDGYHNDIAVFYDYGNSETRIHLFKFNGSNFTYSGSSGWWSSTGYITNQITNRIVSGDFDNDGYHDDIAVFYDFGNSTTKLHVFKSNSSSFTYSGSSGWWNSTEYIANQITGRIVSGDFDNDGFHDDIAAFYNFGNSTTKLHVFKSNSSNFTYSGSSGWWNSTGYIANQITGRVVSGDFDNDGFHDDITTFYDFGNSTTKLHVFKSNSSNFTYSGSSGWWQSSNSSEPGGYDATLVTGRVISGDFNGNGKTDGFVGMYAYGTKRSRTHVWNKINGINKFNYVNNSLGFPWVIDDNISSSRNSPDSEYTFNQELNINQELDLKIYPNPVKTTLNIETKYSINELSIFGINGQLLSNIKINSNTTKTIINVLDLGLTKGFYFIKIKTEKSTMTRKLIIK